MSGGKGALGAAGVALAALVVGLAVVGGAVQEDDDAKAGDGLDLPTDVRAIPAAYRSWVLTAGRLCAEAPPALIAAQIEQESGWNPNATSPVGAEGLSQFMPGTWQTWGVDANGDGDADPRDPADAIMAQGRYDCWLAKKVKEYKATGSARSLMLAAYNAGPGAVQKYHGVPPYPETQAYVARILELMRKYQDDSEERPAGVFGQRVVAYAKRQLGLPYRWGGGDIHGPTTGAVAGPVTPGFDCSGLVLYAVYQASGGKTTLPRTSQAQGGAGTAVTRADLRPGDAVVISVGGTDDHIGIYLGGDQMLHAPRTGDVVKVESLATDYWQSKKIHYRRYG
ncbi:NlpC/P60 family protein [Streptomyces sp. NRRL F-5630]|uniref:C40 family peptidase n=1 Tax=Streptomyces sp. NRRL F-5630 TaxID=1463864 RepID=UPI003EBA61E8